LISDKAKLIWLSSSSIFSGVSAVYLKLLGRDMPVGDRALNPNTRYFVYEFAFGTKIFYVGVAHSQLRMRGRWSFVKNLLKHEDVGTLKPAKARSLATKSNQVIAALIRSGANEYDVLCPWTGTGKTAAEAQEKKQIKLRLSQGCRLANQQHAIESQSVDDIVSWLLASS
jgi:hypothetical protein